MNLLIKLRISDDKYHSWKINERYKRAYYRPLKEQFDNWKIRNLDNIDKPKTKGDDIHELFTDHLNWLNEIGYKNVDLFIEYHLWYVISGQK